jgi:PII-like signaling protein
MWAYVAIAVGGTLGCWARYAQTNLVQAVFGRDFPLATLSINVIGSFLMGFLFILTLERLMIPPSVRVGVLTGVLGGYTTFQLLRWRPSCWPKTESLLRRRSIWFCPSPPDSRRRLAAPTSREICESGQGMANDVLMVRIYLSEADHGRHRTLMREILSILHDRHAVQGVIVFRGIAGFGPDGEVHADDMLRLNIDLPLAIEFFDEPEIAEAAIHLLDDLVPGGHIVSWPAKRHGAAVPPPPQS